ncbi:hypothetical protein CLOSTMETH_00194 [[Clostridium] methylpentosum DSM 5476]|uniref:Uncharacterized protein n=1 Tax=[Clostridium] methylpentosum DSM 5476 TaxID=537013 RepID=C0E8P9_9FIRM|nr:hypothetical protein CLOSTMETH_00194 [[Clostridium] methylpentosum DSM 5476]
MLISPSQFSDQSQTQCALETPIKNKLAPRLEKWLFTYCILKEVQSRGDLAAKSIQQPIKR